MVTRVSGHKSQCYTCETHSSGIYQANRRKRNNQLTTDKKCQNAWHHHYQTQKKDMEWRQQGCQLI